MTVKGSDTMVVLGQRWAEEFIDPRRPARPTIRQSLAARCRHSTHTRGNGGLDTGQNLLIEGGTRRYLSRATPTRACAG